MFEGLEEGDGDEYAENAIEGSGVGNRIDVRTEQQASRAGLRGGVEGAEISRGVDSHFGARGGKPTGDFAVTVSHRRRKKCAADSACVLRERGELRAAGKNLLGAKLCVT